MEDQLVSYETAKLAKEKGFQEKTFFGYVKHTEKIMQWHKSITFDTFEQDCEHGALDFHVFPTDFYLNYNENKDGELMSAPTQSLLQKWIREKHKIVVLIYMYDEFREDLFSFYIIRRSGKIIDKMPYKSYEESLEHGLYEALKLINN